MRYQLSWCCQQDAQKKAKEEERLKAASQEKEAGKGKKAADGASAAKDPDPDGKELAAVALPLEEAAKLLKVLRENADGLLKTHVLGFEVTLGTAPPSCPSFLFFSPLPLPLPQPLPPTLTLTPFQVRVTRFLEPMAWR
jgi:hypothetical protein